MLLHWDSDHLVMGFLGEKVWKVQVVVVFNDTCTYQLHNLRKECRLLRKKS